MRIYSDNTLALRLSSSDLIAYRRVNQGCGIVGFKMKITVFFSFLLFAVFVGHHVVEGVEYYSLSYSYFDEIAQAYCTAKVPVGWWAYAVRRERDGKSCRHICKRLSERGNPLWCFDTIYMLQKHKRLRANPTSQTDPEQIGMQSHRRGPQGCFDSAGDNPNYCCCKSRKPLRRRIKKAKKDKKNKDEDN